MSQRLSDVVLAALTQQMTTELESVLVSRIQAMGIGSETVSLNAETMNDLRRVVRRILGEAALEYRDTTGADDGNV
ncbi:hypothetical protein SAMN05446935_2932 [Burkholderia sp. YR290]|nr:hypothetical protein SAMN05446935_2932 [Burkholderia sp. YR290]